MGSVLKNDDLERIDAKQADTVFILCDKDSNNPEKEDTFSVVTTLSIENCNPNIQTFAQVISTSNKGLLKKDADFVLCLNELRAAILAKNILVPGSSTLITNLFTSYGIRRSETGHEWMREYLRGMNVEIYPVKVPMKVWKYFDFDYYHFTTSIYLATSFMVMGLCSTVENFKDYKGIKLCPPNQDVNQALLEEYGYVLVLCQELAQAERLSYLLEQDSFLKHTHKMPRPERKVSKKEGVQALKGIAKRLSFSHFTVKQKKIEEMTNELSIPLPSSEVSEGTLHTVPKHGDDEYGNQKVIEDALNGNTILENHVLVYGEVNSAERLIYFLRLEDISDSVLWRPILILTDAPVSDDHKKFIAGYRHVYLKQGTGDTSEDLKKSAIQKASACLILDASDDQHEEYKDFDLGMDGLNIMRFLRLAENMTEDLSFYCVELVNPSSVAVLNATTKRREKLNRKRRESVIQQQMNSPVAISKVRSDSGFRERELSQSIQEVFNIDNDEVEANVETEGTYSADEENFYMKGFYACGKCFVPSLMDKLLVQAYYSFNSALVCDRLVRGRGNCHLFLCSIPPDYYDQPDERGHETTTFFNVFYRFLHHRECLAIALYRAPTRSNKADFQYVYTAPEPTRTIVGREDQVYLLGPEKSMKDIMLCPLHVVP